MTVFTIGSMCSRIYAHTFAPSKIVPREPIFMKADMNGSLIKGRCIIVSISTANVKKHSLRAKGFENISSRNIRTSSPTQRNS
jgi:hypothetical protein